MLRSTSFLAAVLWLAIPSTPACAQDQSQDQSQSQSQPSLGDIARQARKDKEKNAAKPKTVITDENLPSSKGLGGLGDLGSSQGEADSNAMVKALDKVAEAEAGLRQLQSLDRATLAKAVLLDNDVDFPNRRAWEDKLFAAKERYVSHEGELIVELKQIVSQAQSRQGNQGKPDLNDPRTQQIKSRLLEIVQDALRTEQDYRAVVMEGWDLAKQARH
jgi:hypothetical protein